MNTGGIQNVISTAVVSVQVLNAHGEESSSFDADDTTGSGEEYEPSVLQVPSGADAADAVLASPDGLSLYLQVCTRTLTYLRTCFHKKQTHAH